MRKNRKYSSTWTNLSITWVITFQTEKRYLFSGVCSRFQRMIIFSEGRVDCLEAEQKEVGGVSEYRPASVLDRTAQRCTNAGRASIEHLDVIFDYLLYLCEQGLSTVMSLKTKKRNRLNLKNDARIALSVTEPRIRALALQYSRIRHTKNNVFSCSV